MQDERSFADLQAALVTTGLREDQCAAVINQVKARLDRLGGAPLSLAQDRVAFAARLQDFHSRVNGLLDGRIFRDPS